MKFSKFRSKIAITSMIVFATILSLTIVAFANVTAPVTTVVDALLAIDTDRLSKSVIGIGGLSGPQLYIAVGGILTAISPLIQYQLKRWIAFTKLANTIAPLALGLIGGITASLLAGASPFSVEGVMIVIAGLTGGATGSSIRDIKKRATNPS